MKRIPWKYLAGLIDGEGCIDVQVTRLGGGGWLSVRPRLRIGMADTALDLLRLCQANYGGRLTHRKQPDNPNWQASTAWECVGYRQACSVLRNIVNHLILKREQARFCLWMEQNVKGKHVSAEARDAIRDELKLMKRDPQRLSEKAQERVRALL